MSFVLSSLPTCQPSGLPLSPCSPNVQSTARPCMSSKPFLSSPVKAPTTPEQDSSISSPNNCLRVEIPPLQRHTDPRIPQRRLQNRNPLVRSAEKRRNVGRQKFLDSVRAKRDDNLWQYRTDQFSRQKFFSEQRQWEARRAQEAQDLDKIDEIDEEMYNSQDAGLNKAPQHSQGNVEDHNFDSRSKQQWLLPPDESRMEDEVDAIAVAEQREMDALIALGNEAQPPSSPYGSDDDGLDEAMADITTDDPNGDSMDMSR